MDVSDSSSRQNLAGAAHIGFWRRRQWPSRAAVGKTVGFLGLCAAAVYLRVSPWSPRDRFHEFALSLAAAIFAAVALRGRLRNVAVVVASICLCLAAAEFYALVVSPPAIETTTPGFSAPRADLGWGPAHPGVFHDRKIDPKTGSVIYDVDYTIDAHRDRRVISASAGPTVAFFGDSMTFGQGLPDADTLPQAFADATGRRLRVVDLAVPGYGPQQFLRALETDTGRDLLTEPRLFVFLTAPWHAERSACTSTFVPSAPRYVMIGGRPTYEGACIDHWPVRLRYLLTRSAMYRMLLEPAFGGAGPADMDLYIAILIRAGQLARERYGVATLILYRPYDEYVRRAGFTDEQIMRRLREGGLLVVDAGLDPKEFPGQDLKIPGDGHPTGITNRAWAALVHDALAGLPR